MEKRKVKSISIYNKLTFLFLLYITVSYALFIYMTFTERENSTIIVTTIITIFFGSVTKDFVEFIFKSVDPNLEINSRLAKLNQNFLNGLLTNLQICGSLAFIARLINIKYTDNFFFVLGYILFLVAITMMFYLGIIPMLSKVRREMKHEILKLKR